MIENINGVKNPLTIIAIFAGLAEISGTGILPFITETNQATYIWFLMIFPVVLVVLFFLTLNFNPRVLYSPSDFRDEANYMKIFEPGSAAQKLFKIQEEVEEESEAAKFQPSGPHIESHSKIIKSKAELLEMMNKDPKMRYQLAENLVIDRLTRELGIQPQRDLSLRHKDSGVMFDAVFNRPDGFTVVEVKFYSKRIPMVRMRDIINRIEGSLQNLPHSAQKNARLILAIAHEMPEEIAGKVKKDIEEIVTNSRIIIEVRMFSMSELIKDI
jgi:hypothetical protein